VYYLSRRRRPELVALDAGLQIGGGLGRVKPVGRIVPRTVQAILSTHREAPPGRLLEALRGEL